MGEPWVNVRVVSQFGVLAGILSEHPAACFPSLYVLICAIAIAEPKAGIEPDYPADGRGRMPGLPLRIQFERPLIFGAAI